MGQELEEGRIRSILEHSTLTRKTGDLRPNLAMRNYCI
jgi:hypothetical protein